MKICGIIVEYNPLHNGHLYHLNKVKKQSDCVIAVMSGNFTQRGEPAIISKSIRTLLALKAGVDIVVELPYLFAVGHADLFCFGAISILNNLGVKEIMFGSESNNISILHSINQKIDTPLFNNLIKTNLKLGLSYPESANNAIKVLLNKDIKLKPNDLLALQYIRQANKINKNISLKTIKRIHNDYHDKEMKHNNIVSATSIRYALKNKIQITNTVPSYTLEAIKKNSLHFWDNYFPYLKYKIISQGHNLINIHDVNEGIENSLLNKIKDYDNFSEFVSSLISKRYTRGRIQRILTHILNNVTKEEVNNLQILNGPQYIRILGFKEDKSHIIRQLKTKSLVPLITNINKNNYHLVKLDLRINNVYHLIDKNEERKIPVILKKT